jgi:Fur family ferric uptake transcriptional regulator
MGETLSPGVRRLREAGYKLTHARLTVLSVLEESPTHLTSSQVLEHVAARDASIGRASVFRALDLLLRLGIVHPTYIDSPTPVYVLMSDGGHHHIICTHCGRVMDFEDCVVDELTARLEERFGVRVHSHMLEFYGECADCIQNAD